MTEENLKKGNELKELIQVTEQGLNNLITLKEKSNKESFKDDTHYYNDGMYWLSVSEHSDGSGGSAKLTRYLGNEELLDMIINKLSDQLAFFKSEFNNL